MSPKHEHRLGESKYKLLTVDEDYKLTPRKQQRFEYTFNQVIDESKEYGLIKEDGGELFIADVGEKLLNLYQNDPILFNQSLCQMIERKHKVFRFLVELMYHASPKSQGLVMLPTYSPWRLGMLREEVRTTRDISRYSARLAKRLEQDIQKYTGRREDFIGESQSIVQRLIDTKLIPQNPAEAFDAARYNAIINRFRNFWNAHLLRNVYGFEQPFSSFERWTHRGKQIGVVHRTENYPDPNFNGLMVYPTSIVRDETSINDFNSLYQYGDLKHLLSHEPNADSEDNIDMFVKFLVKAYFELRRPNQSYFIDLISLREMVCYSMKIASFVFDKFLDRAYKLNLSGQLRISISLEADKTPEDLKTAYLKREPVVVDGKYRTIIAIDVTKQGVY